MVNLRGLPLSDSEGPEKTEITSCVFNIKRFAIRDGPGAEPPSFSRIAS